MSAAPSESPRNPGAAADVFEDIADDYPETPNAAEARYREGRARVRAGDWVDAYRALKSYMDVAPVNPHLAEVEELRRLVATGIDRGYLTFEEIASTLEEVEVTKEQVGELHARIVHGDGRIAPIRNLPQVDLR